MLLWRYLDKRCVSGVVCEGVSVRSAARASLWYTSRWASKVEEIWGTQESNKNFLLISFQGYILSIKHAFRPSSGLHTCFLSLLVFPTWDASATSGLILKVADDRSRSEDTWIKFPSWNCVYKSLCWPEGTGWTCRKHFDIHHTWCIIGKPNGMHSFSPSVFCTTNQIEVILVNIVISFFFQKHSELHSFLDVSRWDWIFYILAAFQRCVSQGVINNFQNSSFPCQ